MARMSAKQKRFCDEYLIDLNATQSAIRAGYSEKTAQQIGTENLSKPVIKEYIEKRMKDRSKRTEITQDKVLRELALIAFSNAADYAAIVEKETVDDEGNPVIYRTVEPVLTEELTEDQKKAIAVIKKGRDVFEVKPYDKIRALELIGKHIGMFTDKVELNGRVNNPMAGLTTEELKKLVNSG